MLNLRRFCMKKSFFSFLLSQCLITTAWPHQISGQVLSSHSVVSSSRPVRAVQRSMDWTLEDNMVDSLFFCVTLTGRRRGHTPFVQAGAETSDTGAEAVKPDPGSSWEGHPELMMPI